MSNTAIHNTPSKKGTASRHSSNTQGRRAHDPQLREDIKKEFERLQSEIERLQADRYDKAGLRHAPRSEGQDEMVDREPSVEEIHLVEQRIKLLDEVWHQSLKHVLPIANDHNLLEKLQTFATLIDDESAETVRYLPYADLYNSALEKLAKVQDPSLRQTDSLNLRLSRADPIPLKTTFFNSTEKTERKPDFLRTSEGAARETHSNVNIGGHPTKGFEWFQALSCEEMKTFKHRLTQRALEVIEVIRSKRQPFELTELPKEPKIEFMPPETPETMQNPMVQQNVKLGSKRSQSRANIENGSSSKRSRTSASGVQYPVEGCVESPVEKDSQRTIDARVQVAGYAMEMLSYSPGVVHVINTLIVDEALYVWYYDRQGNISSFGISIIADFPRFLLLLLAFQRFTIEDWGIVPFLNPKALKHIASVDYSPVEVSQNPTDFTVPPYVSDDLSGQLSINLNKYLSAQPHCLSGRMTSVFKASSPGKALAVKIYSPEVQRIPEGHVIRTAQAAAEKHDREMLPHLPELYFSGDLRAGCTLRVRSILGISGVGHRTLRLLAMNELQPITTLTDAKAFVSAWVDVVSVHSFLWKHGIEHGDPSLWNAMIDPASKCGVLTDYDLSVMAWLTRIPGTDRTGTIPFMALELLKKQYWDGKITRYYYHELEACIWELPVVFIAYDNGKLNPQHKIIKDWLTSDYDFCLGSKLRFLDLSPDEVLDAVNPKFTRFARPMYLLCELVKTQQDKRKAALRHNFFAGTNAPIGAESHINYSRDMWKSFITILSESNIGTSKLMSHMPNFDHTQCEELFKEMHDIYQCIHRPKKILSDEASATASLVIAVKYNILPL